LSRENYLLPRFSVRRPVTVLMIFVALIVVGIIVYSKIPLEMLPGGYDPPGLSIYVPYRDATPQEIENQITRPIEQILGTVRNVYQTASNISSNSTWISVQFNQGTDMDLAYAEIRDRMDRVKADLPSDVERIYIRHWTFGSNVEMSISLMVQREYPDLYYQIDRHLAGRLRRIDGVASVEIEGTEEMSFEIELDKDKTAAYRINMPELVQDLRGSNFTIPGGFVREGDSRLYIRAMASFKSIDEIKTLEIRPGVLLEDVATVSYRVPRKQMIVRTNEEQGIWLSIQKKAGANSVAVHKAVISAIKRELETNPNLAGISSPFLFGQGDLIISSVTDLQEAALWAGMFAVLVLFFFLRHVRMTLLITLAIPISLLSTVVIMFFCGQTINMVTLMGLMICIGLVVDNSVVVVENIFRHRKAGDAPDTAAVKGAGEVGMAVVTATMTTIVVFLPLMLMTGNEVMSFMMTHMGVPVIFALLSSLAVALVFIPLITTIFKDKGRIGSSKSIEWSRDRYIKALGWALRHRVETVIVSVLILVGIFAVAGDIGFQGEMDDALDTNVTLRFAKRYGDVEGKPLEIGKKLEEWCTRNKDVLNYHTKTLWIYGTHIRLTLFQQVTQKTTPMLEKPLLWAKNMFFVESMQKDPVTEQRVFIRENLMKGIGLVEGEAELFLRMIGSTSEKGIVRVVLEGPDYEELRSWGERVKGELIMLPDVLNVESDLERGVQEVVLTIDRDLARAANVDTAWAVSTVGNAIRGVQLPKFQDREREIDIHMRLREQDRQSLEDLRNLRIPTADGNDVALATIAKLEYARGPSNISHLDKKPNFNLNVTCKTNRLDKVVPMINDAMLKMGNGYGYSFNFGEQTRRAMVEGNNFLIAFILAVIFVFLLMGVLFESFALPLTIIACIPFAFAGSFLLLKIYGLPANIFAYIGIIIIVGVVVNNGIVLVDLINRNRRKGMERLQAISLAGYYRFRPILMTAGTTIFSLLPMAFGDSQIVGMPYNPMGMAMIGGLALNTLLTLIMVPVFYIIFDDLKKVWLWLTGLLFDSWSTTQAAGRVGALK
jgi:HAE1 family hydrophobic/amphiphilic exporter-1